MKFLIFSLLATIAPVVLVLTAWFSAMFFLWQWGVVGGYWFKIGAVCWVAAGVPLLALAALGFCFFLATGLFLRSRNERKTSFPSVLR